MEIKEIFDYIVNNGFAIGVAIFTLYTQYHKIDKIETALTALQVEVALLRGKTPSDL